MIHEYYIGLMSGTSIDGVDGTLVKISYTYLAKDSKSKPNTDNTLNTKSISNTANTSDIKNRSQFDHFNHSIKIQALEIIAKTSIAFKQDIKSAILSLQTPQNNEIHQANLVANQMVRDYYAPCVNDLLAQVSNLLDKHDIKAVAVHGQTIRHQPKMHDGLGYTLQLNQPALLAAILDMPVVCDFRVADLYRQGQAAPLVPAFHAQLHDLMAQNHSIHRHIFCNIGGMSNISLIEDLPSSSSLWQKDETFKNRRVIGFDCGPGNVLLDEWIKFNLNQNYDANGAWAKTGQVQTNLLACFLDTPYFKQAFPKSTGREVFNLDFILNCLSISNFNQISANDVQATLVELTAIAIKQAISQALESESSDLAQTKINLMNPKTSIQSAHQVIYICGGGAYNQFLLDRLAFYLPDFLIKRSDEIPHLKIPPQEMESLAFAWLGFMRMHHQKIDLQLITGSTKPSVLGAVYL
jgi:anhydro-N-acetylmuramic acid kinase